MRRHSNLALLFWPFFLVSVSSANADTEYPIAGTTPWQRPQNTPSIEWVHREQAWFENALSGVKPIYPRSLYFLDNQGHWYTPFAHPGMLPPYDLRGWHQ